VFQPASPLPANESRYGSTPIEAVPVASPHGPVAPVLVGAVSRTTPAGPSGIRCGL
jgi:hypothetical protein